MAHCLPSTILKMVVSSAAEAEIGALFLNAKEGINIWNILKELGHSQPATPIAYADIHYYITWNSTWYI
jgi:hypothetical protein